MSDAVISGNEIGKRCRKYRNALGWSQEKLGKEIGVLGATIAKYEKEGLYDIEKVQKLSIVLGRNLMTDEIDEEGQVGEIGKEILMQLMEHKGYVPYKEISNALRGMSSDRVGKEILKLSGLGMCVRDIYKDFYDEEQDIVFITAKGVITCKNQITNPLIEMRIQELLNEVSTYEEILAGEDKIPSASCYQEYIDLRPGERLIRNLPIVSSFYKASYIKFLKENYETGIDRTQYSDDANDFIPSKGFYYDFLYRMTFGLNNDMLMFELCRDEWIEKHPDVFEGEEEFEEEYARMQELEKKVGMPSFEETIESSNRGKREDKVRELFKARFDIMESDDFKKNNKQRKLDFSKLSEEERAFWDSYVADYIADYDQVEEKSIQERYKALVEKQRKKGNMSPYPCDWFSEEEMMDFARENYMKAQDEDEEKIDKMLIEILCYYPKAKEMYFAIGESAFLNKSTGAPKCVEEYIMSVF